MTIEGHQLGPLLNQQGMRPDINAANDALKSRIGDAKYQQLHDDAYHEIAGSASQMLMGNDRDALAGFLKLQAGDPVAAAEIFNKAVAPTSSESGIEMSPDEYKGMSRSPDDIVSQDQADGYKAFAHDREVSMGTVPAYQEPGGSAAGGGDEGGEYGRGDSPGDIVSQETADGIRSKAHENEVDGDTGGGEGGGRGSVARESAPQMHVNPGHKPDAEHAGGSTKPSAPHTSGNQAHGTKSPADHAPAKTQAASGGRNLSSRYPINSDGGSKIPKRESQPAHSPKIEWAKDPKEADRNPSGSSKAGTAVRNTSGPLTGEAAVINALKGVNLGDPDKRHAQIENAPIFWIIVLMDTNR